jgi:betaine-aldehyde dehydrogenase
LSDWSWSNLSSADRGVILNDWAQMLKQDQQHLVELEAIDTGIPISQVRVNHIPYAIQTLQYYASLAIAGGCSRGRTLQTPTSFSFTSREPLGICAAIGPWNYPLVSMIWKVAPALACGNAILYKPSECTPLTALHAASLSNDVLPPGILQVLLGEADTARQLVKHEHIAKVSVTGSVGTGISVVQDSASTLKRTTLELGGKSPLLIFADANLESAVRVAVEGNFVNNGQVCSNCTRVFVQRNVMDDFLSLLLKRIKESVVIGDNMMEDVNMGPLMMPPRNASRHYDRVMGYMEEAKKDSRLELLYGARGYKHGGGYYCEPTIFLANNSNDDDATIVREEIFGPVMTILVFDTEDEAIARANDTPYGLAAGVMTNDVMRAHRVSKRLAAGNVWVNNWNMSPVEVRAAQSKKFG